MLTWRDADISTIFRWLWAFDWSNSSESSDGKSRTLSGVFTSISTAFWRASTLASLFDLSSLSDSNSSGALVESLENMVLLSFLTTKQTVCVEEFRDLEVQLLVGGRLLVVLELQPWSVANESQVFLHVVLCFLSCSNEKALLHCCSLAKTAKSMESEALPLSHLHQSQIHFRWFVSGWRVEQGETLQVSRLVEGNLDPGLLLRVTFWAEEVCRLVRYFDPKRWRFNRFKVNSRSNC